LPAVTRPSARNAGLRGGVWADPLVDGQRAGAVGDREHLAVKAAVARRSVREPMRPQRERVHRLSVDPVLVGDHLGALALRDEVVALEQLGREAAAPLLLRLLVDREADAAHVLDAGRDNRLVDAAGDA
jgi:hypothetical protein